MKFRVSTIGQLATLQPAIFYKENSPDAALFILQTFGVVQPIFINEMTKHILNPVWFEAIKQLPNPPATLPCLVLDIPESEEIGVSLVLNGGIEGLLYNIPVDMTPIVPYLQGLNASNRRALLALGPEPDYWLDFFRHLDNPQPEPTGALEIDELRIEDMDIPYLDLNLQATAAPAHIAAWNSHSLSNVKKRSTAYHFYVDDFRFESLAKNPEKLLTMDVQLAVELNFSTHEDEPGAIALYDIWRKRTAARRWQDGGIHIIVDMNVTRRFLRLNLAGVPRGWRAYANRAYTADFDHLHEAYRIAQEHAATDDILYIVYGGPKSRELCKKEGWHWLDAGKTLDGEGYGTGN